MRASLLFLAAGLLFAGPPQDKSKYAGTDACLACHSEIGDAFAKTRHASLNTDTKRGWQEYGCESCHGPGLAHGEAAEAKHILNHTKVNARLADASCLSCHKNQATHAGRISGSHARAQVSCVACHSVHHAAPDNTLPLLRTQRERPVTQLHLPASREAKINELCSTCHLDAWASFQRPHAHQLPQGAMSCTDCHNPHSTSRPGALRSTARTTNAEPSCFNCHADKRGPFAFEHAPMRLEGCGSCHEPHGSANPRMLRRAEVLNQCLECHSNTPSPRNTTLGNVATGFHDLRLPLYRNCTSCHVKIHGSHINRDFLR